MWLCRPSSLHPHDRRAGHGSLLVALAPPNASARGIVITSSPGNQTVLTSAIAWLSVQGSDFRALFNGRPVVIATHSGSGGHTVLTALRLQLAHLSAQQP